MDAQSAVGTGLAYGAAIVVVEGTKTAFRGGQGGYSRITASTVMWVEEGDTMPGQPLYSTLIPFYTATPTTDYSINVIGGRDFVKDVYVSLSGVAVDITSAFFMAQIRRGRYSRFALAGMSYDIVDGPAGHVRLRMNPDQTWALSLKAKTAVWDLEMTLANREYTIIHESHVEINPGISRGVVISAEMASGLGAGNNAATA